MAGGDWVAAFKATGWDPGGGSPSAAATPSPSPFAPPSGGTGPPGGGDVEGYIRAAATQRGIDPDVAVRVAQSEGGLVPNRTGSFSTGKSFWPFQLHYGGAGTPYASYGTVAGMGNAFTAQTGWQPGDPNAWQAATDYALDQARQRGWGQWYGARNQGITGFQGIGKAGASVGGGATAPTPARAVPDGLAGGTGTAGDWVSAFRRAGWNPGAPEAAGAAGPPQGGGGGAVFPVAGYTGTVAPHWGNADVRARGGADIMAAAGTPVVSMVPGTVEWATTEAVGGNNVGVRGEDGRVYYYAHLRDAPQVRPGQRVGAGQPLGVVGNTGDAANGPPHLHIGIGDDIRKGADAFGGLGTNYDAVAALQAAQAGRGAPGVGDLGSSAGGAGATGGTGATGGGDWVSAFRRAGWDPGTSGATPVGVNDLVERPGAVHERQTLPETGGDWTQAFRTGGAPSGPSGAAAAPDVSSSDARRAGAASWALSQLGSQAYYDLCERFIELAYGTGGQFGSAGAAGKALGANTDPARVKAGDLVFFRPDATNGFGGHAGIALGNGDMVGATYGGVTRDNYLTNPYWRDRFVGSADPPPAWNGRPDAGDLARGAQQFVGQAQNAVSGAVSSAGAAAGAAGQAAGDWVQTFMRVGWRPT